MINDKLKKENNMKDYKVGDVTPDGFEIMDVEHITCYKKRARVEITAEIPLVDTPSVQPGTKGYLYIQSEQFTWIETDDGQKLRLKDSEYEFI